MHDYILSNKIKEILVVKAQLNKYLSSLYPEQGID